MLEKGLVKMNKSDNLGNRLKTYEALTTSTMLMPSLPVYARIDGRAFHTFCRGLNKPFCLEFVETMQEVTKFLVEKTNARLGYVQSDEISLGWEFTKDAPFNGRLFKLQSVLASMATSKFVSYILDTYQDLYDDDNSDRIILNFPAYRLEQFGIMADKVRKYFPSFDCRVFQLPNEEELANCFLWRENDAYRNSVSMLAQAHFSHKDLQGKSSSEMQEMYYQKTGKNYNDLPKNLKRGSYYQRKLFEEELDEKTLAKIPEGKKPANNKVLRHRIVELDLPIMKKVKNKTGVYFYNEEPEFNKDNENEG